MNITLQITVLVLAALGILIMGIEISKIYRKDNIINGRIYILAIPQTNNIEEFCADILNRYRRNGFGENIIICSGKLTEEEKNIGRLIESADKGIYFIEADELHKIVD